MVTRRWRHIAAPALVALLAASAASAAGVTLNGILYSEGEKSDVPFETTDRAPKARLEATVEAQGPQSWVDIKWSKLEPALLFGGDVNCWVLWAVAPDGALTSLGELAVREDRSGKARFAVPLKQFAMMVTAEPLAIVRKPSDLVAFVSQPTKAKKAKNSTFSFDGFRTGTKRENESIATLKYKDKTPIDLQQARNAVGLMDRYDAEKYAQQAARDARVSLGQANDAFEGRVGKAKDVPDLAMRTTALASEAIRVAVTAGEAQKAKDAESMRLSEMAALEAQTETEKKARMEVETSLAEVERQREALKVEVARVQADKTKVESDREALRVQRDALAQRLSGALGAVAQTQRTGRGLVVSMSSGILFGVGKSELKPDAKVALAKLAGILLMIPDTKVALEGHTDSTGKEETNAKLSLERATSVMAFLDSQGIASTRMMAKGLSSSMPVASNDTAEGRSQNRRVEIIVPER